VLVLEAGPRGAVLREAETPLAQVAAAAPRRVVLPHPTHRRAVAGLRGRRRSAGR
jgi:hypothetical protein